MPVMNVNPPTLPPDGPWPASLVDTACEPLAIPRAEPAAGQTLALVGAKGGVGTTVLASSLAWALSQRGCRVVLLDLDERSGQAALHLCERNAGPTVQDALRSIDRLDATLLDTLLTPCGPHLRMLPAPRHWWGERSNVPATGAQLMKLVETAGALADWVLLDLPNGAMTQAAFEPLLRQVQEVVLVSEPTLPATFNARRAAQWLREHRPSPPGQAPGFTLALNKVNRHHALPADQVRRTLGLDEAPTGCRELPRSDAAVAQATYEGRAVGAVDERDALARAVAQWAEALGNRRTGPEMDGPGPLAAPKRPLWRERLMRWAS